MSKATKGNILFQIFPNTQLRALPCAVLPWRVIRVASHAIGVKTNCHSPYSSDESVLLINRSICSSCT